MKLNRRTVVSGAAWAVPAVAVAAPAPAFASSWDDGLALAQFTVNFPVSQAGTTGQDEIWGTATSPESATTYTVRLSTTLGPDTTTVGTGIFSSSNGIDLYASESQNLRSYTVAWTGGSGITSMDARWDVRHFIPFDASNPTVLFNQRVRAVTEASLGWMGMSVILPPEEERLPVSAAVPTQTVSFTFLDADQQAVPSVQNLRFNLRHLAVTNDPTLPWRQRSWPSVGFSPAPVTVTSHRAEGPFLAGTGSLADPIRRTADAAGMSAPGWRDELLFSRFPTGGTMRLSEHGGGQGWMRLGLSDLTFTAPA